jgi:hypothetical protein
MVLFTLKSFLKIALSEFPELKEDFQFDEGLPYLQMSSLARHIQLAKGRGDWMTYQRVVKVADQLWSGADEGLRNALNVSFLEHIDFDGPRGSEAWALLTPQLQRAWRAMAAYNKSLNSGAKGEAPRKPTSNTR